MGTEQLSPPCGEVEARSASGGGQGARIVALARAWIGTPYVHQASVKGTGCDCLGLLRGVWRELRGAEPEPVPPYAPDARGEETLRNALRRHLSEIAPAEIAPGDVVLFRMAAGAAARHCAIVGERGGLTLIHSRQNKRVSEEAFTPAWRRRLAAAFRL